MVDEANSQGLYVPSRTLDNATLGNRVYQILREDILTNRLLPGTPLQQGNIANALDVSRGPVREALRRLDAEGLVSLAPRRGAVVSSFSRDEFLDAYRVRKALEVLAVRLAIPYLDSDDLEELGWLHQEMERCSEAGEVDAFFSANVTFHNLIVDRSCNVVLQDFYYPLMEQIRRFQLSSMSLRGGLKRSCEEHGEIIEAIKAAKTEEAARLLGRHIQVPLQILDSDSEIEIVPRKQVLNRRPD